MATIHLAEFIGNNREELLNRCRLKVEPTVPPQSISLLHGRGIPLFLDQVVHELRHEPSQAAKMKESAFDHGRNLFSEGFSVGELIHDYGGVCQSITDLAVETGTSITPDDFRTLNRCLDDAIAHAVGEYANQVRASGDAESLRMRNLVYMAVLSFNVLREGKVGIAGATGDVLQRSLGALSDLVNHR